jgi:hypothetical protein
MLRRAIPIFFCFGLLMTFSPLGADVLKDKDNGAIVAVGKFTGADEKTIYWETCEGHNTTFAPRKGYLYKRGNNDCQSGSTNQYPPKGERQDREASRSRDRGSNNAKGDWKPVPVTGKPRNEGPQ